MSEPKRSLLVRFKQGVAVWWQTVAVPNLACGFLGHRVSRAKVTVGDLGPYHFCERCGGLEPEEDL